MELYLGVGLRKHVLKVLSPGDVTGDIEMLLVMPHRFSARAVEESVALVLRRDGFERLLARNPRVARRWLSSVAGRLADSQRRILQLLGTDLRSQIARVLLDESRDGVVRLPQATLAAMIGVRRPSVNKVLKEFESAGWIDVSYRHVAVIDARALGTRAVG